jgi:hypothetical protein
VTGSPSAIGVLAETARAAGSGVTTVLVGTGVPALGLSNRLGDTRVPDPPSSRKGNITFSEWPLRTFMELGALAGAVPCARLHARQVLWEWAVTAELRENSEQVVSELISNAVSASQAVGHAAVRLAGAIAWEALENARTASVRAVGPAKVHVNSDVVREVEEAGLLPVRTPQERAQLLRQPRHAIEYVAAIMSAKSAIAEELGFPSIRNRPDVLAQDYVARSLSQWRQLLEKKTTRDYEVKEDMGTWTGQHIPYLERGVGRPTPSSP